MTKESSTELKNKLKKPRKKRKDPRIELEFYEEIELTDPITGKVTTQKVKVIRYKAIGEKKVGNKGLSGEIELDDIGYRYEESDT